MSEENGGAAGAGEGAGAAGAAAGAGGGGKAGTIIAAGAGAGSGAEGGEGDKGAAGGGQGEAGKGAGAAPDWRDEFAGEDKDFRKRLDRFTDKQQLAKSYREMERKLSSGELKALKPFPDKGSDEEKAAWRKDNGIPDDAAGYKVELPDGLVLADADKPGAERLAAFAQANNWTLAQYNQTLQAYYQQIDAANQAREEADLRFEQDGRAALKEDWGADYKRNHQAAENLLGSAPDDVADALGRARDSKGNLLLNNPSVIKWLAQQSLDLNPAASILPDGQQNMKGIADQKADFQKMMADQHSDYWRGPKAAALQKEYRDLLNAESRLAKRAA